MSSQLGAISGVNAVISKVFTQPRGDLAGRLNSRFTVTILAVSASLLLSIHFWGDPMTCWTPAEFPSIWQSFVNRYCYVHGTYFSHLEEPLDFDEKERTKQFVDYYQWVPYILAVQALFFFLPRFVWSVLSSFSGYDLPHTVQYVYELWKGIKGANFPNRYETFHKQGAVYIWDGIRLAKRYHRGHMLYYYVLYTIIQAFNAWFMFVWLNSVVDSPLYSFSGPSVVTDILAGKDWQETGHFPRITHCDFTRRKLASVQTETVLCVLTLNIYYEKLLVFLYFWMLFVCLVSTVNCFSWMLTLCRPERSYRKIRSYLNVYSGSVYLDKFLRALGPDGIFIIHQISLNVGDLPASYLTQAMYNVVEESDVENKHLLEKGAKAV
ncbi:INX-6 protein [Aphelenchoides avenae]|nr:INX-6 protein [Aphelenchus avenae]